MNFIKLKSTKSIKQYIWNTAAGLLNAAEAIILGMITNRITGMTDSGILTLAFSVGNLFSCIGRWGNRSVQVSDSGEFAFKDYLEARIVSVILQIIASLIYLIISSFINNYSLEKSYVIFLMVLIYAAEMIEDIFWGHFQKYEHIETGAQIFIIRWFSIIVVYGLSLYLTRKITISLTIATVISFIVLAISLKYAWKKYVNIIEEYRHSSITILKKCFPIMLTAFVSFYILNAPKFSIDAQMGNSDVAIYGFIAMPVFAISLLSSFIYYPKMRFLSNLFHENNFKKYIREVLKQIVIIFLITLFASFGAWLIGIPVLEMIFASELADYRIALTILIVAGGFLAIVSYLSVTLIIEKKNHYPLIANSIVAILSIFLYKPLIIMKGIDGASIGLLVAMLVNAIILIILEFLSLHKTIIEYGKK